MKQKKQKKKPKKGGLAEPPPPPHWLEGDIVPAQKNPQKINGELVVIHPFQSHQRSKSLLQDLARSQGFKDG